MGFSPGSTILSIVTVDISWNIVTFDFKRELLLISFKKNDLTNRPLVHKY